MEFSLSTRKYTSHSLSRRRVQTKDPNLTQKNEKMSELWNFMTIFGTTMIQISTNMPGIGSLIRKIAVQISEM